MSVTLIPDVEERLRHLVETGQYPDINAALLDALQLLEERNEARLGRLREQVRSGFESGDGVELTPELWGQLVREAEEEDRQGLPIRDDVTP